jgi:MoxR-like ATPase
MTDARIPDARSYLLSARPLLATRADMDLFVGRDRELNQLKRAMAQKFSVLLVGERGSGRTSLIRALMYASRLSGTDVPRMVYVRAAGLTDPAQVLNRVLETHDRLDSDDDQARAARTDGDQARAARTGGASAALDALAERQIEHPFAVLLDDIDPAVGNVLFGVLRDELWETQTPWLVTATSEGSTTILAPPADAFFEMILQVDALSKAEAIDLMRRRLPLVDHGRLESIARHGGQPRELIELARQIDWQATALGTDLDLARRQWDRALTTLGRPASMLVGEMRDLGPVSASDERLLARVGWTRPRVLQVLAEIERAGLATSSSPPQSGPGRPKKVYRLLTLQEWAATQQDRASAS